jgi:ArsR family transcriptional regulator, arsenate/arsenite/antimonite-responsive transcriptional repressor / arsenate reductase (thioredoxin)
LHPGTELSPLSFFQLAGHPMRWRLLGELARCDRRANELAKLVGRPNSLVSYHLSRLHDSQLVWIRRSSANDHDYYYGVDLALCGEMLAQAGHALHPSLRLRPPQDVWPDRPEGPRMRVLFLCTGNSTRSQIAQALIEHADSTIEALSAGSQPKAVHPNAVSVMREYGIDIAGRQPKHISEFISQRFDFVISLCDKVREVCPEFPGQPRLIHWSIADPASEHGTNSEIYPAFQATAAELKTRIRFLLHVLD